jgi:ribosomal protein L11 methyltransferase
MSMTKRDVTFELMLSLKASDTTKVEILKQLLVNAGVNKNEIVELNKSPYSYVSVYCASKKQADKLKQKIDHVNIRNVSIEIKPLRNRDWRDRWKTDFRPFHLTRNIDVVPIWLKDRYQPRLRQPIYMDTSLAFGTGLHETTRFMAQLIERCRGRFNHFFDIGTGTGILSIVAFRCGASRVHAIDNSMSSVEIAKSNLLRNGYELTSSRVLDIKRYKENGQYDFVAANLFTQDLIALGRKLLSFVKPGKYLAVSGISVDNYKLFKQAFHRYPVRCLRIYKGKKWIAVLYKKLST